MLRTIIIEDEPNSIELLSRIVQEYCPNLEIIGSAGTFITAKDLINKLKPDLLFLDIQLKDCNAFELLADIPNINFKIIFTTAFNDFAFEAFKFEAVDYLLKPFSPRDVKTAVEKANKQVGNYSIVQELKLLIESEKQHSEKIRISTNKGIHFLNQSEIIRIEASGSYTTIYIDNKKPITSSRNLKYFTDTLNEKHFFRVHASHLINLDYISQYKNADGGSILLKNDEEVPVSRRNKKDFLCWFENT